MPILSAAQIKRFVTLCGASARSFVGELESCGDDDEAVTLFGIDTRRANARSCCAKARPGCTSTRSTRPDRRRPENLG